jgi:hypothetical protein
MVFFGKKNVNCFGGFGITRCKEEEEMSIFAYYASISSQKL